MRTPFKTYFRGTPPRPILLSVSCMLLLFQTQSPAETYVSAGGHVYTWKLDWATIGTQETAVPNCLGSEYFTCSFPIWNYEDALTIPEIKLGAWAAQAQGTVFDGGYNVRAYLPRGTVSIHAGVPGAYEALNTCYRGCLLEERRGGVGFLETYYQDVITLHGPLDYSNPVPVKLRGRAFGHSSSIGAWMNCMLSVQAAQPTGEVKILDVNESDFQFDVLIDFEREFLIHPRQFQTEPYQFSVFAKANGWGSPQGGRPFALTGLHIGIDYLEVVLPSGYSFTSESGYFLGDEVFHEDFIYPEIVWATPPPIPEGTPLSKLQLNATADMLGTYEYDPPPGTILPAGNGHLLKVHFIPRESEVFPSVDHYVLLDVIRVPEQHILAGPVVNTQNGHKYYLLEQSTWVEGEAIAQAMGGHLATVRNEQEQNFIYSTFGQYGGTFRHLMIGLYDGDRLHNALNPVSRRSEFSWVSGEPVSYSNWLHNEPNNINGSGEFWAHLFAPSFVGDDGSVVTSIGGLWNDVSLGTGFGGAPLNGVVEVIEPAAPLPVLTALEPTSAVAGGDGFALIIGGQNFTPASKVYWNSTPRQTTYLSATELSAQITKEDLAVNRIQSPAIQVGGSEGPTSNTRSFAIVLSSVGIVKTIVIQDTGVALVSALSANDESGLRIIAQNTGGEPMSVLAAPYSEAPINTGSFHLAGATFVDVQVLGADLRDDATVYIYYSTDVNEENLVLEYFDGTRYRPVLSSGGVPPLKDTTDHLDGTASDGRFSLLLDSSSTPKITELTGTIFGVLDPTPQIHALEGPAIPLPLGSSASVKASFATLSPLGSAAVTFLWGDGSSSSVAGQNGSAQASHVYGAPGVYTVGVQVSDPGNGTATRSLQYIVVYNPDGGFVIGGGWILSPPGSYLLEPQLTGKASFGFVAKYQKGVSIPEGNTEFQFKTGNLNFQSTAYQWLVVAGARAQFKGFGTINGAGNYGFLLTAIDGQLSGGGGKDKFRIKIWDAESSELVYDNQVGSDDTADLNTAGTLLGGGSIVIHKP
jgi:hypothetical protein